MTDEPEAGDGLNGAEGQADGSPEPEAAPGARAKRPVVSKGAVVVLVAGVVAVVVGGYFAEGITGYFALKGWAKNLPVDAVARFAENVAKGDVDAAMAQSFAGDMACEVEDGRIVTITPNEGDEAPVFAVEEILPTGGPVEPLVYHYAHRCVEVFVPTAGGGVASYMMIPSEGEWKIDLIDVVRGSSTES